MKIQVRDNGVGIDASALSKLQDYHKIWNIDIDVSGTGIGLIGTIQRIVLIYGEQASYQIRSVPEGGTEITFLLPVTWGEKRTMETGYDQLLKVMFVDDEEKTRKLLRVLWTGSPSAMSRWRTRPAPTRPWN